MKRLLLVAWLVVGLGAAAQAQTLVYDNTVTDTFYWAPWCYDVNPIRAHPWEHGDNCILASTERTVTQIELFMNNPTSDPATADLTIRLYAGDPSVSVNLLWSYTDPGHYFINNQYQPIDYPVPNITVPGNVCSITYELTNYGTTCPGVGFERFDPPAVGSSDAAWYVRKVNGVWEHGADEPPRVGNFGLKVWAVGGPAACRGDCNCDGTVDFGDINPFVAVLAGGTPCSFDNCDVNGDGSIDFGDINPFVTILSGGGGPCQ